jgi:hypothetical protein
VLLLQLLMVLVPTQQLPTVVVTMACLCLAMPGRKQAEGTALHVIFTPAEALISPGPAVVMGQAYIAPPRLTKPHMCGAQGKHIACRRNGNHVWLGYKGERGTPSGVCMHMCMFTWVSLRGVGGPAGRVVDAAAPAATSA